MGKQNGGGRRTKFTPDRLKRFAQAIELGATVKHACDYAGFCERSYYEWRKDAEDNPDSRYKEILTIRADAESRGVVANLARIQSAAKDGTWTAAAWLLERKHPEIYGRRMVENRTTLNVSGLKATIERAVAEMTDEELGINDAENEPTP